MEDELDWPPPEARVRAAIWRAEGHLERGEYSAAANALAEVFELARPEEREFLRGLHHLAAAGYKAGDERRARRQLAHARRRLALFQPTHRELDVAALLDLVERDLGS